MQFEEWMLQTLIEQKLITKEDIKKARELQQHYLKQGQNIPLGNILINNGCLDTFQLLQLQKQFQLHLHASKGTSIPENGTIHISPKTQAIPSEEPPHSKAKSKYPLEETAHIAPSPPEGTVYVSPPAGAIITDKPSDYDATEIFTVNKDITRATSIDIHPISEQFGKYKVICKLGQGEVGQVYLVFDPQLNREVALKVLLAGEMADEVNIARFRREAQAIAKLRHPNIIVVYDIGQVEEIQYFTMDYIKGKSLREMSAGSKKPMTARKAMTIIAKLARALDYAHKNNIVHRDVKPGNILVDEKGQPYLMDFGLAKDIHGGNKISRTGTIAGTASYMSPEQASGKSRQIDGRSDIYALGATLYEMITGQVPFTGTDLMATLQLVIYRNPKPPHEINPHIPQELERICLKALEKKKENRYANAIEMAEDLEQYFAFFF